MSSVDMQHIFCVNIYLQACIPRQSIWGEGCSQPTVFAFLGPIRERETPAKSDHYRFSAGFSDLMAPCCSLK